MSELNLHIHLKPTEKTGLAMLEVIKAMLLQSKVTQAHLDELDAQIRRNTDEVSAGLSPQMPTRE